MIIATVAIRMISFPMLKSMMPTLRPISMALMPTSAEPTMKLMLRRRFAGMPTTSASSESFPIARIAMPRRMWRKKTQSAIASAAAKPMIVSCASVV